jgi:hypothetical protein
MGYLKAEDVKAYREKNDPGVCPISQISGYSPCVDHDHQTGRVRGVLPNEVNIFVGKIENYAQAYLRSSELSLSSILRNVADYLEQPQGDYHYRGVCQLISRFGRSGKSRQIELLRGVKVEDSDIEKCRNGQERKKLYAKRLRSGEV